MDQIPDSSFEFADDQNTLVNVTASFGSDHASVSAQSEVLGNPDILEIIFSYFHIPPEVGKIEARIPAPDSKYLLSASLACTTFFDPAMNILWRSIDSWTALVRLIPTLIQDGNGYWTTTGIIREEHLERLELYTRRIRHFHFHFQTPLNRPISAHIYHAISTKLGHPLFPTLKTLNIPDIGRLPVEDRQRLFLILSPTLFRVSIGGVTPSTEILATSLLDSIGQCAYTVATVRLGGQFTTDTISEINTIIKTNLSQLEGLEIDVQNTTFPTDYMKKLSDMVSLKSLSITLDERSSLAHPPGRFIPFPEELHTLHISGTGTAVLQLLQPMNTFSKIRRVSIHFASLGQGAPQDCLEQCIQRLSWLSLLQSIQITSAHASVRIPSHALELLHPCKQLKYIQVTLRTFAVTALSAYFVGSEWRGLEALKIDGGWPTDPDFPISLLKLKPFLQHFPSLKTLAVSVALANGPQDLELMRRAINGQPLGHKLEEFMVLPFVDRRTSDHSRAACSTTKNGIVISRYLDHLFPFLKRLDFSGVIEAGADWREGVEAMVRSNQELRRIGREQLIKRRKR